MTNKTIRIIFTIMLLTLGALFVTQAYWFKKSFNLERKQLNEKLNIALRSVAHQLLILDHDTASLIPPVTQTSSNEFLVETDCFFQLIMLDSLLYQEFLKRDIHIDFDYLILKKQGDQIVLGNTFFQPKKERSIRGYTLLETTEIACRMRPDYKENLNFKIRINNKNTYLLGSMGIWIYSSFTLLLILVVFTFTLLAIIRSKKLDLLKKDFVNNMTHELKTPIANIAVASDTLRNKHGEMASEKLSKYADIIYKENNRLHHLVDSVLQLSEIEKEEETLHLVHFNIHEIIVKVKGSFEPLIKSKNGQLSADLKAKNITIFGDQTHLSNVVSNLIENAIKYSPDSPNIAIETSSNSNELKIEVSDQGIGINTVNHDKIFDKFFRAETGNVHNTKGYGLGLSYVKLIMDMHHGKVSFHSTEGQGSTFILTLPL